MYYIGETLICHAQRVVYIQPGNMS